jgi:hypothetical protein
MHIVKLTHALVCSSLGWSRLGGPYLDFVGKIDNLTDRKVIWQPFTDTLVPARAPQGLSSMCFWDRDFWMTKTPLVHDM